MKKGEIVLIPFPFTDLSGTKNRPAMVLAENEDDVTVAFITTQTKWQEVYDSKIAPSILNGLKKESLIRINKLSTIDKNLVIGRLGQLTADEIKAVNQNLKKFFEL